MIFRPVILLLSLAALASEASQSPTVISALGYASDDEQEVVVIQSGTPAPAPVAVTTATTQAPKSSARLDKLKKLEFDRRPSAILAVWSTPPKPKEEKKASEDKPGEKTPEKKPEAAADTAQKPAAEVDAKSAVTEAEKTGAEAEKKEDASTAENKSDAEKSDKKPDPEADKKKAEAEKKKAEAEAAKKKKAEEEAAKKAAEAKALEEEITTFQHNVTLGDWTAVKNYLASLSDEEKKAGYERLLQSLQQGPSQKPSVPPPGQQYIEKNRFAPEDVLGLALAAPLKLTKANLTPLGLILRQALDAGHQLDGFLVELLPRLDSSKPSDAKPSDAKASDTKASDTKTGDTKASDTKSADTKASESKTEDTKKSDAQASGAKASDTQPDHDTIALTRRQLALILVAANEPLNIGELLPTADDAAKDNDREGLNLISRHALAKYEKEKKVVWLESAWKATQSVLAIGDVVEETKTEALKRAVDIAPKIQKELGQAWLDESFKERPERGMEILAVIGSAASMTLAADATNADKRMKLLELQTTAANALLAAAPERATQWKNELALLAGNWLREATVTYQYDDSTSLGPRMQRDVYGNFYYWDENGMQRGGGIKAIRTNQILDMRPSDEWLSHIDETLQPRFQMIFAQLLLKVGEEARAFPYIESLAATHKKPAKDLADEFLRVWTKNHDPNAEKSRTNPYMFMYGFEERANGIPLTRSKQERNLKELGEWVARLKKLAIEVDVELLASAFTSAHSTAEVYRLDAVEQIFGKIADLDPATLAELVQRMRVNLATVWRDPALQEKKKTNRRQKDIQGEVLRGYELAQTTLDGALADHPDSWELVLAQAALQHDENGYRNELKKDPESTGRRAAAFESFHKAAALYAAKVDSLDQEKETTKLYEMWFYAALGACDLKAIDHEKQLAAREIPLIRQAIAALPGERAERHTAMFANALLTRMSNVAPAVKFRYVREGLAITGDHKLTREARQIFDYYNDLVTEIQLRASIDGSDRVGHAEPFGLRVDLRHTRDIERESGGFSKYLQNQNSQSFGWNYGRPLEDYRTKFEDAARETLKEQFDVISVTFNDPQAKSKADAEYGWRVTPYAYFLLKPRGAQVDRVPPLRLDLDFLDTTGYAIIPVESAPVPIDATAAAGDERPYEKLTLTQTLDERQAKDGKLILEVKASAVGLVPKLESILGFDALDKTTGGSSSAATSSTTSATTSAASSATTSPATSPATAAGAATGSATAGAIAEGFDIKQRDDHGVSVVKFDEEGSGIDSERTWTITMRGKDGLSKLPESFSFAKPRVATVTSEQFRYVDADLASVGATVALERQYGKASRNWMWWIPVAIGVGVVALIAWRRRKKPEAAAQRRFQVPDPLTPFSVLGVLQDIERRNGLAADARRELGMEIQRLERHFFVDEAGEAPDLRRIAESWVGRAS